MQVAKLAPPPCACDVRRDGSNAKREWSMQGVVEASDLARAEDGGVPFDQQQRAVSCMFTSSIGHEPHQLALNNDSRPCSAYSTVPQEAHPSYTAPYLALAKSGVKQPDYSLGNVLHTHVGERHGSVARLMSSSIA